LQPRNSTLNRIASGIVLSRDARGDAAAYGTDVAVLVIPPRRIVTDRLVVRCYEHSDAQIAKDAVDSSVDHLRAFMNWAWELPEPVEVIEERIAMFRLQFEAGDNFTYGFFTRDETELVGGGGLHRRAGPEAFEIGYWIRASRLRQGLVTEATAALTRAAFDRCGVERVEIHIDPANVASLGVPPKLGYMREATLRRRLPPIPPSLERRDEVIFSLLDEEYPGSAAAAVPVEFL
jgi:RimJ/RimL family protein N-acetyltransferase